MTPIHPVILSGGAGTRLWPLSRALYPKQLLPLVSDATLLQETVARVTGPSFAPPLVICNHEHRFIVAEQLRAAAPPPQDIVLEPVGRNTAPAVAVAALMLAESDPDALILVLPSDHVVRDVARFHAATAAAAKAARAGYLVTFGIEPDHPETGYGYIRQGTPLVEAEGCLVVDRFVEKPDHATAVQFIEAGGYCWNSGMFLFRAGDFLDAVAQLQPDILAACRAAIDGGKRDLDFFRLDARAFERCPSISIDYGVMEKTDRVAVVPVDMGWNDVGSWSALWDLGPRDAEGNVTVGDVIAEDSANNYLRTDSAAIAALGIRDLIVVATKDAVLVAPRERAQDVKTVVDRLERDGREMRLHHVRVHRPWGWYQSLDAGEGFQVKRICVAPGAKLSLQYHHHRAEHWIVIAGTARITNGEKELTLARNQSTYIPLGAQHRLENPDSEQPLHIIEVQSGDYLGEDDIVRLEDIYARD